MLDSILNSRRAKRAPVRAAGVAVVATALLAAGASAAWAAPEPIDAAADIRPSNILFTGASALFSSIEDADGVWAGDAYDDFGYFRLDPGGTNEDLTFSPGDCTIDGSESGGTFTSNPTILTCTALDVAAGYDTYDITVTRTFRGSWVRWDFAATGSGPLDVEFYGDLGSDTDTTYYPGVPASNATTWVSGDNAADGDLVLFSDITASDLGSVTAADGDDLLAVAFTDAATGDRSFRFDQGLVDYNGAVADPAGAYQCAVDYTLTLSDGNFGGLLNPPGCGFDYSGGEGTPPPSWFQATGRATATATCADGWRPSYDMWPNGGTGGFTCEREEYWDTSLQGWAFRGK